MTKKITIEVSAYDTSCGVYIGDEYLKGAIWELENIGGKYISSIYVPPVGEGCISNQHTLSQNSNSNAK